jgi:hypothetical protein
MMGGNMTGIIELFTGTRTDSVRFLQFEIIVIFVLIILFFKYFYNGNYVNIISLIVFAYIISNMYKDYNLKKRDTLTNIVKKKYENLQKIFASIVKNQSVNIRKKYNKKVSNSLSYLSFDADIIVFLDSVEILPKYNELEYYNLLNGFNNLLRISSEAELYYDKTDSIIYNIQQQITIYKDIKSNMLQSIKNYIYVLPASKEMREYIEKIYIRAEELINRHYNKLLNYNNKYIKEKGINTHTQFTEMLESKIA